MLGAIAGDIIGSAFENAPVKTKEFCLLSTNSSYTDDTVLTLAVADVLLAQGDHANAFRVFYRKFPDRGYGEGFQRWVASTGAAPCYSHGNGSAMRVSPIGWFFPTLPEVLDEARRCAVVTHNHVEGIRGAQAVAASVFLARHDWSKSTLKTYIATTFNYDLDRTLDGIRPAYSFTGGCDDTVPEAIIAFLESRSYEDAVRNAVSLGGDSDTMACIAGAIAEAYYQVIEPPIHDAILRMLPEDLVRLTLRFREKYCSQRK